jgi:uncharacterized protein with HEPN domain
MYPSQVEFLKHILDECNYLLHEHKTNTFEDFLSNQRLVKAICRSLEVIGEAASHIHPDLREMSDIRNKIIHDYFGIDYDIVWDTVNTDIPVLKEWIELILNQEY